MTARAIVGALVVALVAACSSGDDPTETVADSIGPTTTTADSNDPDEAAERPTAATTPPPSASSTPTTLGSTTTSPTTTTTPTTEPARPFGDVPAIEPATPTDGNGDTPTLAWAPVEGATSYSVVVFDPDGAAWWAWEGAETEIVLGGVTGGPGALIAQPGTTWTVVAFDTAGTVLAASPERRLDP